MVNPLNNEKNKFLALPLAGGRSSTGSSRRRRRRRRSLSCSGSMEVVDHLLALFKDILRFMTWPGRDDRDVEQFITVLNNKHAVLVHVTSVLYFYSCL